MPAKPISELELKFSTLEPKVGLKFLRAAGRTAAKLIADRASELAPSDTGYLKDHIAVRTKKESDTQITMSIRPAFYGRFVEQGTKHIKRKQPFLVPALEAKSDEAATVFAEELKRLILEHFNG